jgi:hypothetical protein
MNTNPFKEYKSQIVELEYEIKKLNAHIENQKEQIFAWTQLAQTAVNDIRSANDQLEKFKTAIVVASGIISTLPEYKDKHPEEIMKMLIEWAALRNKEETTNDSD